MDNEIKSMPMVPLRGMTILPEMVVHFDVSRQRSIAAVQEAMSGDQKIFLTAQRSIDTENPDADDVYEIGTVGTVKQIIRLPKQIFAAGKDKFKGMPGKQLSDALFYHTRRIGYIGDYSAPDALLL